MEKQANKHVAGLLTPSKVHHFMWLRCIADLCWVKDRKEPGEDSGVLIQSEDTKHPGQTKEGKEYDGSPEQNSVNGVCVIVESQAIGHTTKILKKTRLGPSLLGELSCIHRGVGILYHLSSFTPPQSSQCKHQEYHIDLMEKPLHKENTLFLLLRC